LLDKHCTSLHPIFGPAKAKCVLPVTSQVQCTLSISPWLTRCGLITHSQHQLVKFKMMETMADNLEEQRKNLRLSLETAKNADRREKAMLKYNPLRDQFFREVPQIWSWKLLQLMYMDCIGKSVILVDCRSDADRKVSFLSRSRMATSLRHDLAFQVRMSSRFAPC
jgi:hypothetical protein